MGRRLHHASVLEHVDAVGFLERAETMRHHDDGARARKLLDEPDDGVLAVGVDVGGGLVEHVHRRVVKEGARHGDALALSAREVAALRGDGHVEPARFADEIEHARAFEGARHLLVACVGLREQEVRPQRSLEKVAVVRDRDDGFVKRGRVDVVQFDAADLHGAGVARVRARQDAREGRLARPAFAGDADEGAARRAEANVLEDHALSVVGVPHARRLDAGIVRVDRARARGSLGRVEDGEHLLGSGHAVHGRVEKRPERAQAG